MHFLSIKIRDLARAKLLHYSVIDGKENNLFIESWAKRFLDELETTWDCLKSRKCSASEKVIVSRCEALQARNIASYIVGTKKEPKLSDFSPPLSTSSQPEFIGSLQIITVTGEHNMYTCFALCWLSSRLLLSFLFFHFVCKQFSALSSLLVVFTLFFLGNKLWTLVNNKICAARYQRWKWKKFSSCLFVCCALASSHVLLFALMPSETINGPDHVTSQQWTTIYRRRKLFRNFNYAQMGSLLQLYNSVQI